MSRRKLEMDFQPIFMAGFSMYERDPSHWEHKVQPRIVAAERPQCRACGFIAEEKRSLIQADEVWSFPSPPNVTLVDVRPLCRRCHDAKDFAHLLNRIRSGHPSPEREGIVRQHYCELNGCSEGDFTEDFQRALAAKNAVEDRYTRHCRPIVDYGLWGRPPEKPFLTDEQKELMRRFCEALDEPVMIHGRKFSVLASAVRTLQNLSLDERHLIFAEAQDYLDDMAPDDPLIEVDEGVQFQKIEQ
jgi:hypothetical protein